MGLLDRLLKKTAEAKTLQKKAGKLQDIAQQDANWSGAATATRRLEVKFGPLQAQYEKITEEVASGRLKQINAEQAETIKQFEKVNSELLSVIAGVEGRGLALEEEVDELIGDVIGNVTKVPLEQMDVASAEIPPPVTQALDAARGQRQPSPPAPSAPEPYYPPRYLEKDPYPGGFVPQQQYPQPSYNPNPGYAGGWGPAPGVVQFGPPQGPQVQNIYYQQPAPQIVVQPQVAAGPVRPQVQPDIYQSEQDALLAQLALLQTANAAKEQAEKQKAQQDLARLAGLQSTVALADIQKREKERVLYISEVQALKVRFLNKEVASALVTSQLNRLSILNSMGNILGKAEAKKLADGKFPEYPNFAVAVQAYKESEAGAEVWDRVYAASVAEYSKKAQDAGAKPEELELPEGYIPDLLKTFPFTEGAGVVGKLPEKPKLKRLAEPAATGPVGVELERPRASTQINVTVNVPAAAAPQRGGIDPKMPDWLDGATPKWNDTCMRQGTRQGGCATYSRYDKTLNTKVYEYTFEDKLVSSVYAPIRYDMKTGKPTWLDADGAYVPYPSDRPTGIWKGEPFWVYAGGTRITYKQPKAFDVVTNSLQFVDEHGFPTDKPLDYNAPYAVIPVRGEDDN